MIRVLHIVSNISKGNGIMSVLMNYYRNINREEFQFDFIFFDAREKTYEKEIIKNGGKIIHIANPKKIIQFRKDKNKFYNENINKYNVVHIHDLFMTSFFLDIKNRMKIKKVIIHAHNMKYSDSFFGSFRNRLLAISNKWFPDYYCACSVDAGIFAFGKDFLEKGIVIHNAINLNSFYYEESIANSIKKELCINQSTFVVGHVGGFVNQKNHKFLVDIFEKILLYNENSVLVLVSDGPLKNQTMEICKKKKIEDKVLFLGTRADANRIMQSFDVFVFPSLYEGLGIVLIEAQALGIPCVYSDTIPKEASILEKQNRILSLSDNADVWAKNVLNIGRSKKVTNACEYVKKKGYDIEREVGVLEKLYKNIVEEKNAV